MFVLIAFFPAYSYVLFNKPNDLLNMQILFLSSVDHIYLGRMEGGWEKGWNKRDPPGIQKSCDSQ